MYKLLLCLRYLRTKYIALACIISVMLGVATMIVVNSVMAGFSNEMRDRLHNFLADIVVESRSPVDGMPDSKELLARVEAVAGKHIAAMTPAVEIPGLITFNDPYTDQSYTFQVHIQGIDPAGKALVGPMTEYLDSYNPIEEDGVVVRPPLRSASEPLGWELTPDAAEYRRLRKQSEAWRWQPAGTSTSGASSGSEPVEFDLETSPGPSAATTTQPAAAATSDTTAAPVASVADGNTSAGSAQDVQATGVVAESTSPASAVGTADESAGVLPENPFGTGEENAGPASVQTGPLKARVILGEGIVSFQTENPRTGKLEKIMMVNPGDDVILGTVSAGNPPDTINFSATVVDTFRSGMNDLDTSVVLMNLEELQNRRGMIVEGKDAITSIHIRLKDYDTAPEVVRLLKTVFPASAVNVRTWEEKQGLLLEAVEVETAILNVLLFLIIAVAGFGILAIFFMIVVEKTRDIGILKSLGASSSGIMSIFLSYGLALGMVGSLAGVGIGLLFVAYINEIEDVLSWITGRKVFDEKIYYFHEIPTHVSGMMVFLVALGAITIAVLASVLPARRASRLHPVRALRFE